VSCELIQPAAVRTELLLHAVCCLLASAY
jgi:hypothetical protein